ncbi:MAG: glycosyltransferase family 4 protein, partial [Bacilli bacterium]
VVKKKLDLLYPKKGLRLLGNLSEERLINSLLESNIYVMASHIENSPNNLCEAMILGMPCIATYAGGTGSLIRNEEEGILIQDGDPWVMAGAIKELIDNKEKAELLGSNARLVALSRHDKANIKNDLLNIYRQVIRNN